jgi:plastocyanin
MHFHTPGARRIGAVLAVTGFAIAACGGGGGKKTATPTPSPAAGTAGAGGTLSLQANQSQLRFDKSALSAGAGKVTIVMKNPSALQHDVAIEGNGVNVKGKIVGQGGTSTVTASLKPGTYTYYCSVDAHRQAGMEGTLTVK